MRKLRLTGPFAGCLLLANLASAAVQIDFNKAGRQETEVNEPGWTAWPVGEVATETKAVSGITFTVTKASSTGANLSTDWYKTIVQAPNYGRMIGDGLFVKDGNAGGAIKLEISGLSAGTHTLLTYHNSEDGNQWGEINVDVDGVRKASLVKPTNRAFNEDTAALSYVTFTATAGKTVTILYSANSSSSSAYKNVILNGIVLDVPNPRNQAKFSFPSDRDWHVNGDAGSITLHWHPATGATTHRVFVGTDSATVAKATTTSSTYKGVQADTNFVLSSLSPLVRYWWRVDEVSTSGAVTTGQLWCFEKRRLAFPEAEGYGRFAHGGRGGKVVHVTNLNDAGTGSLREAVENDVGPRTIVFDVGGKIVLKSRLTLSSDRVTFAGQTAPGKGIVVTYSPFGMSGADDAIIRFLKVRVGYTGITWDGTGLNGCDYTIMDHTSVGWSIDEAFSSRNGKHLTLQRTMISEALNVANHQNYPAGTAHGYAATIGGGIGTYHHNLLAHNEGRNWSLGGGLDATGSYAGQIDIFNNVVYNWDGRATDGGAHEVNFVGNYYKEGPATRLHMMLRANLEGTGTGSQAYYYHNNVLQAKGNGSLTCDGTNDACGKEYTLSGGQVLDWNVWNPAPFFQSRAVVQTAAEAYKDVLSDVGMTMPVYDDHDKRIIKEVLNGTATYKGSVSGLPGLPDRESDVGGLENHPTTVRASSFDTDADGLPNWWEALIGTNPSSASGDFSDANADRDGDGYTNLEDYLDWMAVPHATTYTGSSASFDLAALFAGYTASPSYSVTSNAALTTTISSGILKVVPKSAAGFLTLTVSVKDAAGSTKSRRIRLYVGSSVVNGGVIASARSLSWSVSPSRIGVHTDAQGVLELRDLAGRLVARAEGTGEIGLETASLPRTALVAHFRGEGLNETRMVPMTR